MKYYIGVDGGGTKTAICMAGEDSSVLYNTIAGSASWREHGVERVVDNIRNEIHNFPIEKNGIIAGIALGLPLVGESTEGDHKLENALSNAFPGIPVYLTNDVEVGWAGSLNLTPGINIVAGTGSIAFGKNESGETARCGGWSEFFSDEGSCYWIGRKVLELFSKQSDGRIPKDELYHIVKKEFDIDNDYDAIDLIHNKYMIKRENLASLQLLAKEAALAGAQSALDLYNEAVDELCLLITAVRDRLQFEKHPFLVSYSGGLFKSGNLVFPRFFAGIEAAGGKTVTPKFEPVYGALLLAFEKSCPEGLSKIQKRLEEE